MMLQMVKVIHNMIPTCKTFRIGFHANPSPQTGGTESREARCWQTRALQSAGVKAAILLAAMSALAIFLAPCTVGFSVTSAAPAASLSPTSLSFGKQNVGTTSAAITVTLSNNGNASLSITNFMISGLNATNFTQTNNCGRSVAAGASCTIRVTFKPTATGTRSGTLTISDNAAGRHQNVGLSGTGTVPAASLSSTHVSFSSRSVGTTSGGQSVTLRNTGSGVLNITSFAITGTNAGDFAQTNTCGNSVAAGGNCTISVTFTPSASGSRTASVSITDNASGSPQAVGLSGTGTVPAVSLSPASLSFGSQSVGTTSAAQTVTLTNSGNATLSITSLAMTGANARDFAQTNNCGSSIAGSGKCTISVTFTPSAGGSRAASVSITDNASTSPLATSLSGTGAVPAVSLSAGSLSFGNQSVGTTSAAQTVTLTNSGNATLTISSLAVTSTSASDFAQTNTCGSSLAAGGTCAISVTFKPSASGSRTASVSIADNGSGSPQAIGLSGTGTATGVSLSPGSLSFGNQSVGTTSATQTVTLTNGGNAALTITSLTVTGTNASDFAQTNTCGSSVAAGGNCTISVSFKPSVAGSETASVTITDNASSSPQAASLSGTGSAATVSVSPTSLSYGNQPVSTTSAAQTVTLTNGGNVALSITSLTIAGTNIGDFAEIANTCGSSVAAGGNCTIGVTFKPSAAGQRTATLSITDNASGSPQAVSLSGTGSSDVILSWVGSPSSGVVGYNVYRGTASGGESSTPLNSTPINGTSYVDANVTAGATYYYVVTTVGSSGVQSAPSNETGATP